MEIHLVLCDNEKITTSDDSSNDNTDLKICSPFQAKRSSNSNYGSKHKTQLKINRMPSYNMQSSCLSKTTKPQVQNNDETIDNFTLKSRPDTISNKQTTTNTTGWKIKAIIDNRNFLIPVR
jgi:hypothetical protein